MARVFFAFFFFNDTATTEIYTLSLHDALPILLMQDPELLLVDEPVAGMTDQETEHTAALLRRIAAGGRSVVVVEHDLELDRKSTRLNSSHANISYAVFCLKKKKIEADDTYLTV